MDVKQSVAQEVQRVIRHVCDGADNNSGSGMSGTLSTKSTDQLIEWLRNRLNGQSAKVFDIGSGAGHFMLNAAIGLNNCEILGCELEENQKNQWIIEAAVKKLKESYPNKATALQAVCVNYQAFSGIPDGVTMVFHFACGFTDADVRKVLDKIKASKVPMYVCSNSKTFLNLDGVLGVLGPAYKCVKTFNFALAGCNHHHPFWVFCRIEQDDVVENQQEDVSTESGSETDMPDGPTVGLVTEDEVLPQPGEKRKREEEPEETPGIPPMPTYPILIPGYRYVYDPDFGWQVESIDGDDE